MSKNIQISEDLFWSIARYFYVSDWTSTEQEALARTIRKGITAKLDAMTARELYSTYKTAQTQEEREKARQEYLEHKGIPASFRSKTETRDK